MTGGEPTPRPEPIADDASRRDRRGRRAQGRDVRRGVGSCSRSASLSGVMLWFLLTKIRQLPEPRPPRVEPLDRAPSSPGRRCSPWPGSCLSAARWQAVLAAMGQHRAGSLLSHYMAGQFVANVLPTTIGGDVLRASRLSRDSGEGPTSFAPVVLERLTGWVVLPAMTFFGFLVNPGLRHLGKATQVAISLAAGTLVLLALVVLGGQPPLRRRGRGEGLAAVPGRGEHGHRPAPPPSEPGGQRAAGGSRLPARARRGGGHGGPRPRHRGGWPDRAARLLPRGRHRTGAPDQHLWPRRAGGAVRPVPHRSASRPSRRSPSACCCTC